MKAAQAVSLAVAAATLLAGTVAVAQPDKDAKAPAQPVMQQLDAFRRDDYDSAYTFASEEIKTLFDRQAFERMVKTGYPEIARSTYALVSGTRVAPDGHVYLTVKIRGANGHSVEAIYDMVWENSGWRINGVVAKPDPGFV